MGGFVLEMTILVSEVCRYLSISWAVLHSSEYTWFGRPENKKGTRGKKEGSDLDEGPKPNPHLF